MMTFTKFKSLFTKTFVYAVMLIAVSVFACMQEAHATHAAGSDLTYQWISGNTYRIEVTFYRDCAGIAEPANVPVNYKSTALNLNLTVTANKIANTGQEITVPCATSASTCNGGTSTGIRKFVYQANVTLPGAAADWTFSYHVCCRNCAITTIQNPCANSTEIYVESKLNNVLAPGNSSPTFSNIPVAFVCMGQMFNYNHGVLDTNGDSLSYSLITPKISATTNVSFVAPASSTNPISSSTPFTLNAVTGQLTFTPNQQQIGILAILVKEYRNGQLIGSVIRDMQVYTTPCNNNLPTASGINGTSNYSATICPNQQFCFDITTADADASQVVTVINNSGISNATYTVIPGNRPTIHFCWTPTISDIGLNPHTFTVTVKDNACPNNGIQTFSYNLYVPGPNFTVSSTNVTCNNLHNGTGTVTPVYSGNFTYNWNTLPVQTTATAVNLAPGTYSVIVTDANACSLTQSVTITQPSAINASLSASNIGCFGSCNGAINLTVNGGVGSYSYLWSNGQTVQNVNSLCAGNYSVIITDATSCTKFASVSVSQPAAALNTSPSVKTDAACFGNATGSVDLTVTGGAPPYNYTWSNGATTQDINNLSAGSYTVSITDANNCILASNFVISQPSASLNVSSSSSQHVSCYSGSNGSITLNVTGGTAPYSYNWSNGATSQIISNLSAGTYTATVTDANNCVATLSQTITQPSGALSANLSSSQNVSCYGGVNGSVSLNITGGSAPYSYNWNTGAISQNINNLSSGTYTVTVSDANGCSTNLTQVISQPSAALSTSSSANQNVSCYGGTNGSILLNVNGGTSPYSFNWSNGATTQNINGLSAGTYIATVTDANGCNANQSQTINQPSASLSSNVSSAINVSCFGGNNGTINLNVSGGTLPYSYNWSNGATTQSLNGIAAGNYSVTITDANGCSTVNSSITVAQPPVALNGNVSSSSAVSCWGGNNGSINLSVNGGTAPYSYSWSNGAITQNISNLSSGTYSVIITDINGCTTAVSGIAVTQPGAVLNSSVSSTGNVNCFGGNNGSINLVVIGGTAPYSYNWSNGMTTQNLNNVVAGTYNVSVTDANGCSSSVAGIVVSQPAASLNANVLATSAVSCFGGNNGSILLNVNGGTAPYSYNWSNGSISQNLINVPAGTYSVTITDVNGCLFNINGQTISQPATALNSSVASTSNVSCFGGNNGSIVLNVNGGTAPYSYSWSNGANTQNLSNISSGTYSVIITDANGCTLQSAAIIINQPAQALNGSATTTQNVSCNSGANGTINLTVNGGTAPYSYSWSNGASTQDINGLYSGTYVVTVTDAQGCLFSTSAVVSQPAGALNSTINVSQNVNCFGGNNGSIALIVNGGTAPYSYTWSNGASTQNLNNLSSGTYAVTIADANGCINVASATVNQPSAVLSGSASSTTDVSCFGGANGDINLSVNGGTLPYIFQWNNGATTQNISNLSAGTYSVTVTDINGCTTNIMGIAVSEPGAALNGNASSTSNVSCFGGNNGDISLAVSGGTAPYSFQWSNGANTQNISNLAAGTYTVTVTDVNGCVTTVAGIAVNEPAASLNGNVSSSTDVNCFGGNNGDINLIVNGGTAPYSYNWSNGATTQNISNLAAGTYTVSVTDINGCSTILSGIAIIQPNAALSASVFSQQNVNCYSGANGSIDITTVDGTAPYIYNWSNGETTEDISNLNSGTYSLIITDANTCTFALSVNISQPAAALNASANVSQNVNCYSGANGSMDLAVADGTAPYSYNWSNGEISEDISNLAAGVYTVTVTDANGCIFTTSATVTQPAGALNAFADVTQNVSCNSGNNGSIDLTVIDGTAPYLYNWSNGETTEDINNLASGTYSVSVTDANGCVFTTSAAVTQPAGALNASANVLQNVSCYSGANGSIDLTATDGTAPYAYIWNNGETVEDISNLAAGVYTVTVTDANGCVLTTSATISQPNAALNASANVSQNVSCYSGANGSIDLTATDGTAPYSYIWSNSETTEDINNLAAGIYTVTVTDANGCVFTTSAIISQPNAALNASVNASQNVSCYSGSNGSIDLTTADGTAPYNYVWSNGEITEDISNLSAGTYTVTVTDANGCVTTVSATITQPNAALNASVNASQNVSCYSGANGSIDLTTVDGTAPYTYVWSNGEITEDISNLSAGVYTVTVTDANGCVFTTSATITQPSGALNASIIGDQPVSCFGGNNGFLDITVMGGTVPYYYNWSNGATTQNIGNLSAGFYMITVTDANGCVFTASAVINQPNAALNASVNASQNVSCYAGANGTIDLTVIDGTAPYSYNWSNGANTEDLNGLVAGNYSVIVTDANGCSATSSATIIQPQASLAVSGSGSISNCLDNVPGDITISVNGGTSPYTYLWNNGATTQNLDDQPAGIYTVTITDANGCNTMGNYVITDGSVFHAQASGPAEVCMGELVTLMANSVSDANYQWYMNGQVMGGQNSNVLITPTGGMYYVTVSNACGSFISDSIEVKVHQIGDISTSPNVIVCPGESTQLYATGGVSYEWTPANSLNYSTISNPIATPSEATKYEVTITNEYGCKTTATIEVGLCDTLIIPSGYSPNDDVINDYFEIKGIENYPGNKLWIYNRWGNLIYKAHDYDNSWNGVSNVSGIYIGKKVPAGTYFYVLDLNNHKKPLQGYVVLKY